ncbi:MAG: 1-acyl-sn-glycerol-3-phosphate acyltransferase [Myxococcota bacterium]
MELNAPSAPAPALPLPAKAPAAPVTGTSPRPDPHVAGPELLHLAERLAPKDPHRFDAVDDRKVLNETGMLARRGILTRLFSWLAFRKVGFDERDTRTIRDAQRDGELVYVMNHHSVLDDLYFNFAFLRLGLPLAFVANTISTMLFFRPLWAVALHGIRRMIGWFTHRFEPHERVAYALARRRAALVFLKIRQIWPWATAESTDDSFLATVVESQLERVREAYARAPGDAGNGSGAGNGAGTGTGATSGGAVAVRPVRPITIVPQLLVWVHDPERAKKSFWEQVFGNPEAPSRFRKLINFLLNRRRAFVRVGKPIDLLEFLERNRDATDLAMLSRKLRAEIHRALSIEERVIKGPILKRSKQIRQEVLAHPDVKAHIAELAKEIDQPPEKVAKEIDGYLKEMAADFSMINVEIACIILTLVFNRIFHEMVVDQEGLERVREAARKSPLILLPCHRSHIDYLVLSYIFYLNGLMPPHIASGKNLNFFPVGGLFRKGGAFFMRRSFKDNKPYSLAFREYLTKLVQEGVWIEFFLEGGRSRTGKMLSPKFGMLKIIVDAIKSGAAPDVSFVPIYVGYEQVIEEKSFSRELGGEAKKKENLGALLSATKVLWAKYGRLYVNFGEPISCREALEREAEQWAKNEGKGLPMPPGGGGARHRDREELLLSRIGYRITDGINKVAVVTPTSLVAAVLLWNSKRGVARDTLLARVGMMLEMAHLKGAKLSQIIDDGLRRHRDSIAQARQLLEQTDLYDKRFALGAESPLARAKGNAIREAVDEVLARFIKVKQVEEHRFEEGEIVYVPVPDSRINLEFYKNNIVHLVVPEAIVATAIRGTLERGATNVLRVMESAAFLSRTFAQEFVFDPEKGFAFQFAETLGRLADGGLIARTPGEDFAQVEIRVTDDGAQTMEQLHRVLAPWIEAYWLISDVLATMDEGGLSQSKFIEQAQTLGRRRYQAGDIGCPEAASNVNFQHALVAWEEFGLIEKKKRGRETFIIPMADPTDPDRLTELRRRLRAYFP